MTTLSANSCEGYAEVGEPDVLLASSRRNGGDVILDVSGELDLATAPILERALAEALDDPGCRTIFVDLHAMDFMGSTGLSVLLKAREHMRDKSGGELVLARPSPPVMRTIQLAGLLSTFTLDDGALDDAAPT